jgi:transcriptional regulator with XRE-family HTH domain
MTVEELIGARIRMARQDAKLTQAALGKALARYLGKGWSHAAVSLAEKGRRDFIAAELVALAAVFKRPVTWFFVPLDAEGGVTLGETPLASEDYGALGRPEGDQGAMLVEFAGELVQIGTMAVAMLDRIHRVAEEMARAGISVPLDRLGRDRLGQPLADVRVELLGDVIPAPPGASVEEMTEAVKRSAEQTRRVKTRKRSGRKPTTRKGGRK